jgi:RND superfamily putative drug exporter
MERLGDWSARRPWRALAAWFAFVLACLAIGVATGEQSLENGAAGESKRGYEIANRYDLSGEPHEEVLIHGAGLGPAALEAVGRRVARTVAGIATVHDVRAPVLSSDARSAVVVFAVGNDVPLSQLQALVAAAERSRPGSQLGLTGDPSVERARNDASSSDLAKAERLSIPITLVILFAVFGAAVSAAIPVLLALSAVAAALGLLGPLSQLAAMDSSAKPVLVLIGMAVGVDYSLFYVVRDRQERRAGVDPARALRIATHTSGRTVLVSGLTVATALAGLFVAREVALSSIALATIVVVLCAVAGSVTVLPAVISLLGERMDRGRLPWPRRRAEASATAGPPPGAAGGAGPSAGEDPVGAPPAAHGFWVGTVDRVLRRPVLSMTLSVAVLIALAAPALSLHTSKPSDAALASQRLPAIATLNRLQRAFPGGGEPADVVVTAPRAAAGAAAAAIVRLTHAAVATGLVHESVSVRTNAARTAAMIEMPLTGKGDNTVSRDAVRALRERLIPQTLGRIPGVSWAVTGKTAEDLDFTAVIRSSLPYVIAFVLVLAFVLLLLAFRSIVVPLKAIVLNLLSVGAAYGVMVLVFQHHWAEGILGFKSNGTIVAWLPLFLFVILFGLSMDYHVFILSRVRELVDRGESTDRAVRDGIAQTAGVVTGAALVMVGVFSLFASLSSLGLKQAGVGLAAAVLIDATIVRAVLLPATMKLLGERNWYLPAGLARRLGTVPVLGHSDVAVR